METDGEFGFYLTQLQIIPSTPNHDNPSVVQGHRGFVLSIELLGGR